MLQKIVEELQPYNARLIAVSKTQPNEAIMELYKQGQRIFGENKVQELVSKYEALPKDIEWHLIGHLQTNKVKYIAPFVHMIHAVDSLKLLQEIQKEALKANRQIAVLLQIHIATEETKFGMNEVELNELLTFYGNHKQSFNHVQIAGLMGMATFTENMHQVRNEFKHLKNVFQFAKDSFFFNDPTFCELSMGMSGDYPIAIEEGATLVRIGTLLFGKRNYNI